MKRIAILTAGGDTPALNATLFGAVQQANELGIEVYGLLKGFDGMISPRLPHVRLNPLFSTIPELDPCQGGTIIGASRTYINSEDKEQLQAVAGRMEKLGIEGLICIGGDGTINGMQPLSEYFPCVLAPKTIDNDLGLNYIDEPNEWIRDENDSIHDGYRHATMRDTVTLSEIVNYVTPGYATAVFVVAQSIERIRTTAESHRRIAIIEVMGRDSGYIALGAAYGQPDMIMIPEVDLDYPKIITRIRELYISVGICAPCGNPECVDQRRPSPFAATSVANGHFALPIALFPVLKAHLSRLCPSRRHHPPQAGAGGARS